MQKALSTKIKWFKIKLPYIKVPISPPTVLDSTDGLLPPRHVYEIYRPTVRHNTVTDEYEYFLYGFDKMG